MKAWKTWVMGMGVAIVACILLSGFTASRVKYPLTKVPVSRETVRGVFHVHSRLSDGHGTVEEVALAAKAAGLSFVVMADHNPDFIPKPEYVQGVLIISAAEWSTPHGHVVGLGMNRAIRLD
jgi:hypothetical protein